jgi:putative endonuclease
VRRTAGVEPGTLQTGARAERAALRFLEAQGLRLVTCNFRCRMGELDLVMLDGRQLVVVEVRYRARPGLVDPAVTVTATKRQRLLRAASRFLQFRPDFSDHALRFDVLALSGPLEDVRCDWIRSAFTTDDVASF